MVLPASLPFHMMETHDQWVLCFLSFRQAFLAPANHHLQKAGLTHPMFFSTPCALFSLPHCQHCSPCQHLSCLMAFACAVFSAQNTLQLANTNSSIKCRLKYYFLRDAFLVTHFNVDPLPFSLVVAHSSFPLY